MSLFSGPKLPEPLISTGSAQYGETFALVGGLGTHSDRAYLYNSATEQLELLEARLSVPRSDAATVLQSADENSKFIIKPVDRRHHEIY